MIFNDYTILFKKIRGGYVSLCLELNVAAQGITLEEAKQEILYAINGYLLFQSDTGISSAELDLDTLREFLSEQEEVVRESKINVSENFSMRISAHEIASTFK